jgi:hypothetical protein
VRSVELIPDMFNSQLHYVILQANSSHGCCGSLTCLAARHPFTTLQFPKPVFESVFDQVAPLSMWNVDGRGEHITASLFRVLLLAAAPWIVLR